MIAKLLIHPNLETRVGEIEQILASNDLKKDHPDVLWISDQEKLGVETAKKIRQHFSLKPYSAQGRAVVVESAQNFTPDAQNSLLKTLEEPPESAIILLGADSDQNILATILSRVVSSQTSDIRQNNSDDRQLMTDDIQKLLTSSIEQRFEYIEKLENKEEFFQALLDYFHHQLITTHSTLHTNFTKELIKAEAWKDANGNLRAILEYLMLKMS